MARRSGDRASRSCSRRRGRCPAGCSPFAPLALLAVWSAVSIAWSIEPDRSWAYANRGLVYLAFALVGAFAAERLKELMYGLAALLGAVCVWTLAGKALPWLYEDYGRVARLRAPIGYWNALALLGAIALPIGLCLATRRRVPGTLLVYGWMVAIALTYSRGGVVVAVLVVAAWIALSRAWVEALATLVAAGLPAAVVIAVGVRARRRHERRAVALDARDATARSSASSCSRASAWRRCSAASRRPSRRPRCAARRSRWSRCVAAGGDRGRRGARALVVGLVHEPDRDRAAELAEPLRRGGLELPLDVVEAGVARLEGAPAAGTGAGSFRFTNLRYRTTSVDQTTEPHSLPVQFLTETGVVGLLLFLVAGARPRRRRRRRAGPQLALALALPAYLVHGLLDIDWDFAAVSAPVFLIAGAVAARPDRAAPALGVGRARRRRRRARGRVLALRRLARRPLDGAGRPSRSTARRAPSRSPSARARSTRSRSSRSSRQALGEQLRGNLGEALGLLRKATRAAARERRGLVLARRVRPPRPQLPARGAAGARPLHAARTRRTRATRSTTAR